MEINFDQSIPIYLQIIDEIKRLVATGTLQPGDKLPSQRDLAAELKVNANTVQRAYREMELLGLVETLRGQGTFVCDDHQIVESTRKEMLTNLVNDFLQSMRSLGCSEQEILKRVGDGLFEDREVKDR
ncbi:MAG: GntR family transcriptional regulator [Firmicutes bacterium]|nr:GntR family transcriptional regulator [Bacillota bacterium]